MRGVARGAWHTHGTSGQESLDSLVARINQTDCEGAKAYPMPEAAPGGFAEACLRAPVEKLLAHSRAQLKHWAKARFPANAWRMLRLEQCRDAKLAHLCPDDLTAGPVEYTAAIFRKPTASGAAMPLPPERYGPAFSFT